MEHRYISTDGALIIGADAAISESVPEATGVALGPEAVLAGERAVGVGASVEVASDSVAIGDYAHASGAYAVAVGNGAGASADDQVAIGAGIGLGTDSVGAVAVGKQADAGAYGVAIGAHADASGPDAIAIGREVVADAGEVVIGRPDTIARFGGDLALPTVATPPTDPPTDPTKAVIRFCAANGAVYVWAGTAWSVIG